MKSGAFKIAAMSKAPVIPAFITMEDTARPDADGAPVQAYTIWFLPAIYPKESLSEKENAEYMKNANFEAWKKVYEEFYKIPLEYETENSAKIEETLENAAGDRDKNAQNEKKSENEGGKN